MFSSSRDHAYAIPSEQQHNGVALSAKRVTLRSPVPVVPHAGICTGAVGQLAVLP